MKVRVLPRKFSVELEEKVLKWWYEDGILRKFLSWRKNKPKFWILDGPPYVTGHIHLGTAWNKILKDVCIRYYTMKGYYTKAQPGFDCHGLPIEVLMEKKLGFKTKKDIEKFGIEKFIEECKKLALMNLKTMESEFKRLGVFMDWENPYRTLDRHWIEAEWWTFKRAYEQGLIKKDLRVIHWCWRCETALAEHELEYKVVEDPSIYVKFKIKDKPNEYILVWTTTPWTLPANVAVLAHPEYTYVKVKVNDEYWWILLERLDAVMREIGISNYEIADRKLGSDLAGLKYEYPLLDEMPKQKEFDKMDNVHTVVLGEFVRTDEGTGFVHIAPGHGEEDFEIGRRYNLPVYCPVGVDGKFTEGAWKGIFVKDADKHIIETLRKKGVLVYHGTIKHRYPICWRCKSPLLFRATEQWFLDVSKIKSKIIAANEPVKWVPAFAKIRFKEGVKTVGDWCISRQRYWNCPIPLWVCEKCGSELVIGSFKELKRYAKTAVPDDMDLHRPHIDKVILRCPICGGDMKRIPDVLDVWFDSAIASWASLGYPSNSSEFKRLWPADLIIEGHDQVMKWFYAQQVLSVVAFGKAPYKCVVMHGFVLDAAGSKMSKSLGNIIMPWEVIEKYGADALRCYLISGVVYEDIRFRWEEIKEIRQNLDIFWNVSYMVSMYMELDNFSLSKINEKEIQKHMLPEDRWIISRVNNLVKQVEKDLNEYRISNALRRVLNFVVEDLSRWYGKLVRRRLWIEKDDPKKLACYYTSYKVYKKLLPILSLFAPFMTEYVYQHMLRPLMPNAPESVALIDWPKVDESEIDEELEKQMEMVREIVAAVSTIRTRNKVKLRWPLSRVIIETSSKDVVNAVNNLKRILLEMANVKHVEVGTIKRELEVVPVLSKLGPKYRENTKKIVDALVRVSAEELKKALDEKGYYELELEGKVFKIEKEDVNIITKLPEGYDMEGLKYANIILDVRITDELLSEGLARDVLRRIQAMRGELDLPVEAKIRLYLQIPEELKKLIEPWFNWIKSEARAEEIILGETKGYVKEWTIDKFRVKIGIETI